VSRNSAAKSTVKAGSKSKAKSGKKK